MVSRTFLTAVSCWILFMAVDYAALGIMPLPKGYVFQFLPGLKLAN